MGANAVDHNQQNGKPELAAKVGDFEDVQERLQHGIRRPLLRIHALGRAEDALSAFRTLFLLEFWPHLPGLDHFALAAGSLELLFGGSRKSVGRDRQVLWRVAHSQNLDKFTFARYQLFLAQSRHINGRTFAENGQTREV